MQCTAQSFTSGPFFFSIHFAGFYWDFYLSYVIALITPRSAPGLFAESEVKTDRQWNFLFSDLRRALGHNCKGIIKEVILKKNMSFDNFTAIQITFHAKLS